MSAAPITPRPFFAALPQATSEDGAGVMAAPCPSCGRGIATIDRSNICECDHGCSHSLITKALFSGTVTPWKGDASGQTTASRLRITRASDVKIEAVTFLVPDRVPLGAVTLLVGDPGLGKSTLSCSWAAGTSTGRYGPPGTVLLANAEDSASHVVVPRLAAAGADLQRVEFFCTEDSTGEQPFTIPDDIPALEAHAEKVGARLVVVDPLNAHLADGTNAHRDHSIRRALAPLSAMAQRLGIAVLVVAHLNKGAGGDALYRVGGSIGLVGGARSVLLFTRDPDDPDEENGSRRALGHIKSNWSQLAPTLIYAHEPETVTVKGTTVETHKLVEIGESEIDGGGLLGTDRDDPPASKRDRATELLADELADGEWHRAKEVKDAAARQGIPTRTLQRAAKDADVEEERRGFPSVTWWRLASRATHSGATGDTDTWRDYEKPRGTGDPASSAPQSRQSPKDGATVVPLRPANALTADVFDDDGDAA
jgi:putative DNA primase/helicase